MCLVCPSAAFVCWQDLQSPVAVWCPRHCTRQQQRGGPSLARPQGTVHARRWLVLQKPLPQNRRREGENSDGLGKENNRQTRNTKRKITGFFFSPSLIGYVSSLMVKPSEAGSQVCSLKDSCYNSSLDCVTTWGPVVLRAEYLSVTEQFRLEETLGGV